jgi:hypothetical protein
MMCETGENRILEWNAMGASAKIVAKVGPSGKYLAFLVFSVTRHAEPARKLLTLI